MTMSRRVKGLSAAAASLAVLAVAKVAHALPEPEPGGLGAMPRDFSADGWRIDNLIHTTNYFVIGLLAVMLLWMMTSVVLHNAKKKHEAVYDSGKGKREWAIPVGIALFIFFVVDGNLFVNSSLDMHNVFEATAKAEEEPGAVRIEINGHQWAWDARYAGPDNQFNTKDDVVTLNDIRVPVGAAVSLQIGATDVIHAFYVPNMRIKKDAVPGMINKIWFRATQTGEYDIGCAQHCGVSHYKMKGMLTVLPREEYDVWEKEMSTDSERRYDPKDPNTDWGWEWKSE